MNNGLDSGAIDAAMDDEPVVQYAINQGKSYAINMDGEAVEVSALQLKKAVTMNT